MHLRNKPVFSSEYEAHIDKDLPLVSIWYICEVCFAPSALFSLLADDPVLLLLSQLPVYHPYLL